MPVTARQPRSQLPAAFAPRVVRTLMQKKGYAQGEAISFLTACFKAAKKPSIPQRRNRADRKRLISLAFTDKSSPYQNDFVAPRVISDGHLGKLINFLTAGNQFEILYSGQNGEDIRVSGHPYVRINAGAISSIYELVVLSRQCEGQELAVINLNKVVGLKIRRLE